jgi:MraZ protein
MVTLISNSSAPLFTGEFRHAIDGKSRLTIPSAWRFEEEAEFFLTPSSTGTCLKVITRFEIDRIRSEAAALPGVQRAEVLRALGAATRQCRLDKAGRLVVPEDFTGPLNLSGEVTMIGAMENFEIWNSQTWALTKARTLAVASPHLAAFGL